MTRDELLVQIKQTHADLASSLEGISDETMSTRPVIDWWTLKDMLGHIAMWEQVALRFIEQFQSEGAPKSLGLGDDAAVDVYNKRGAAERRDWPLALIRSKFDAARIDLLAAVEGLRDEQLNAPLAAPWESGVTLERLIAWNSYEHVPEHIEQIVKWRNSTTHADHD
ncbi:MAG TPA: DinB family protein [Anaerolineae bacterium]